MEVLSDASKPSNVPHRGLGSSENKLMVVKTLQQLRSQEVLAALPVFSPFTSILVHFIVGAKHFPKYYVSLATHFLPSRPQPFKSTRGGKEIIVAG